ncbi:MAG: hypothetical protein NUV73_04395, partial [Candidatus Daviesbacteria bacterium]|nr:hypothetical protein [Candidatus Daviesbacteria bacterium]
MNNKFFLITLILFIGIIFRLALTENGNFLFNMDSARDFVDVREMVELKKLRLTGPTTAIEGFFTGPFWYYLLAIPFMLSGGHPYGAIVMEMILWAIGGFFLLKLVSKWSNLLILPVGAIWVASNHIVLANLYSFNPTPVMFLTPVFIYLLTEYLTKGKAIYIILTWILGGLFFNFEMNFGVFVPLIILISLILTGRFRQLAGKWFWVGAGCFIIFLLPQVIFDFKHQFIMTKAILRHISENSDTASDLPARFQAIYTSFYNTFLPTLFNNKYLAWVVLGLLVPASFEFWRKGKKDIPALVSIVYIFIPFLGYLVLPVTVNPWHLGGEMAASLILIAFLLKRLLEGRVISKISAAVLSGVIIWLGIVNIGNFFLIDRNKPNLNPSLLKHEIAAIDYVYRKAEGKNFKVYA